MGEGGQQWTTDQDGYDLWNDMILKQCLLWLALDFMFQFGLARSDLLCICIIWCVLKADAF